MPRRNLANGSWCLPMVMLLATTSALRLRAFWILRLICVGSARPLSKMDFVTLLTPLSLVRLEVSGNSERTPDDIRNALNETKREMPAATVRWYESNRARIVRYVALPFDPA
jgi:hypothetical protein